MSFLDDVLDIPSDLELEELAKLERPEHISSTHMPGGAVRPHVRKRARAVDERPAAVTICDPRLEPERAVARLAGPVLGGRLGVAANPERPAGAPKNRISGQLELRGRPAR